MCGSGDPHRHTHTKADPQRDRLILGTKEDSPKEALLMLDSIIHVFLPRIMVISLITSVFF